MSKGHCKTFRQPVRGLNNYRRGREADPRKVRTGFLLNFALADGYIATFDTKYHYKFWRPVTAI
ncbi:MAG: hypothetical protein ABJF23_00765, partial [Bryobacteraceae bacterium]